MSERFLSRSSYNIDIINVENLYLFFSFNNKIIFRLKKNYKKCKNQIEQLIQIIIILFKNKTQLIY